MTRNELKLEIWNRLNLCRLTEQNVKALKAELSDVEIGAFVNLFNDSNCGMAFVHRKNSEPEFDLLFHDIKQVKAMAAQYAQLYENKAMMHMCYITCQDELEDVIKLLQELIQDEDKSAAEIIVFEKFLNYARFLRVKIDSPETDLSFAESEILCVMETCDESWINFLVAKFLCFFSNEIVDVVAATNFFQTKKMLIEQCVREMVDDDEYDFMKILD